MSLKNIMLKSRSAPPIPAKIWRDPFYFIAFGFGSGAAPFAPGTFGTLMAIPFYLVIRPLPLLAYLIVVALFIVVTAFISDRVSREIHFHDHPGMCIDEFSGFFVTMIAAPHDWWWILAGFLLFRLFDIWKPWPISVIDEKVHGGIGMILDDVVAGIAAMMCLQLLGWFL